MTLIRLSLLCVVTFLGASGLHLRADDTGTPGQSTHRMAGIGVAVKNDASVSSRVHEFVLVQQIQDNSPALEKGIKPGDEIVAIDDTKLAGLNFLSVVNTRLRGTPGSVVKITVKRPGQPALLNFDLVRRIIPVDSGK
jgi:C-terminal processing protease CtpA/Prc